MDSIGNSSNVEEKGKFFIKKFYKLLRGMYNFVFWKSIMNLIFVVFRLGFISWIVVRGKFGIGDFLVKWGVIFDIVCELC